MTPVVCILQGLIEPVWCAGKEKEAERRGNKWKVNELWLSESDVENDAFHMAPAPFCFPQGQLQHEKGENKCTCSKPGWTDHTLWTCPHAPFQREKMICPFLVMSTWRHHAIPQGGESTTVNSVVKHSIIEHPAYKEKRLELRTSEPLHIETHSRNCDMTGYEFSHLGEVTRPPGALYLGISIMWCHPLSRRWEEQENSSKSMSNSPISVEGVVQILLVPLDYLKELRSIDKISF